MTPAEALIIKNLIMETAKFVAEKLQDSANVDRVRRNADAVRLAEQGFRQSLDSLDKHSDLYFALQGTLE